jgi:hypothetical protein
VEREELRELAEDLIERWPELLRAGFEVRGCGGRGLGSEGPVLYANCSRLLG